LTSPERRQWSLLVGKHEIPAVEAVGAAVRDDVAGLPRSVLRRVAEQVGAASAVDADDDLLGFQSDLP
jgi:hypothetical protein